MKDFDISESRVIVHNLTLKGIEHVPGVLDFDQRGILCARTGDIVVTKRPPENTFLLYLESIGWDFSGVTFISPKSISDYTYKSVFYDTDVNHALQGAKRGYIDTYQNTREEELFSKRLHMPLYSTPTVGQRYGTKSGFRRFAKKLKLPIVRGFESIHGVDELLKKCLALFAKGIHTVVVKIDEGVSGAGQTLLQKDIFLSLSTNKQLALLVSSIEKIPQLYSESSVTAEEWREDIVASPSIQLEVTPQKEIRIRSLHDQLLEGVEKWYIGCSYPPTTLNHNQLTQIMEQAILFTKALIKEGFVGFLGLDTIITSKGDILWVEANIRKPGTFYPRIIAEKINGGTLKNIYYIACDFTVSGWKGMPFAQLKKKLGLFLYPIGKTKTGIIVYNTGALVDAGRFDIVCIGRSQQEAVEIFSNIKKCMKGVL